MSLLQKSNPWIAHCKAYAAEHKCTYRDAIKLSKATYVPKEKVKKPLTVVEESKSVETEDSEPIVVVETPVILKKSRKVKKVTKKVENLPVVI